MPSLIAKWQKCGKRSCRCNEGFLHGPYFWLVRYISKKASHKRKGKYSWRYLGRNPLLVWEKLRTIDTRFGQRYQLSDLTDKIGRLRQIKDKTVEHRTIEPLLTIEDTLSEQK
jgi:hypothetical protein